MNEESANKLAFYLSGDIADNGISIQAAEVDQRFK